MPRDETWSTTPSDAGSRLDRAVAARPSVGSRRRAREVVESGKVSVDGQPCADPGRPLPDGAVVTIAWSRAGTGRAHQAARATIAKAGLRILHEDAWLLVVDKPPGLLTDPATSAQRRSSDSVTDRLRRYLAREGRSPYPAHRIDRDTSGAVLFAKDERTHESLRAQFDAHTPERVYLAVLQGVPSPPSGRWTDWMAWDAKELIQKSTMPDAEGAVLAEADYRVTAKPGGGLSVVEVRLVTGRRNQIRLHAMLRGHPLVGEKQYVAPGHVRRGPRIARHALHAWRLAFEHPSTRERIAVESPVPADLQRVLRAGGGEESESDPSSGRTTSGPGRRAPTGTPPGRTRGRRGRRPA